MRIDTDIGNIDFAKIKSWVFHVAHRVKILNVLCRKLKKAVFCGFSMEGMFYYNFFHAKNRVIFYIKS